MIQYLVADTFDFIEEQIKIAENPVIAWSGGKDSMVMLYLAYSVDPDITVLYFEGLPHPTKHNFVERVARDWGLNLVKPLPMGRDALRAADGRVEIVEVYRVGERGTMYFPLEVEPGYIPDEHAICGRLHLEAPISRDVPSFDAILIGHRGDDVDPTHGAVPLQYDAIDHQGFRYVYPLRAWTEADIWEASQIFDIPQNEARYSANDLAHNSDYHKLCTGCFAEPTACPLDGRAMEPLDWDLDQRRQAWRQTFLNLPVCH